MIITALLNGVFWNMLRQIIFGDALLPIICSMLLIIMSALMLGSFWAYADIEIRRQYKK